MRDPKSDAEVSNWRDFDRTVRQGDYRLLARIEDFPDAVHVIGCQRSGTTMLSSILLSSKDIVPFDYGRGHELDSALILCGLQGHMPDGRQCFQTTYLNSAYVEYFQHVPTFRMVWVLRNPYSVVYSMLHNWPGSALDRLFRDCGAGELRGTQKRIYKILASPMAHSVQRRYFNHRGKGARFLGRQYIPKTHLTEINNQGDIAYRNVSKVERACYSYNARVGQLFELAAYLDSDRLWIVDYEDLVTRGGKVLADLHDWLDLDYDPEGIPGVHRASLDKAQQLRDEERLTISQLCMDTYSRARTLRRSVES